MIYTDCLVVRISLMVVERETDDFNGKRIGRY